MENRNIEFTIPATLENYINVNKACSKLTGLTTVLALSTSIIFAIIVLAVSKNRFDLFNISVFLICVVAIAIMSCISVFLIIFFINKNMVKTYKDSYFAYDQNYSIYREGITITSEKGMSNYSWNECQSYYEQTDYFIVLTPMNGFLCIPKIYMDAEMIEQLRDCLKNLPIYRKIIQEKIKNIIIIYLGIFISLVLLILALRLG